MTENMREMTPTMTPVTASATDRRDPGCQWRTPSRAPAWTRTVHRLDLIFKACRRLHCAKLPVGIDNYSDTVWHRPTRNAGDKGASLRSDFTNADCVCVTGYTNVADLNVVTATGNGGAGKISKPDIVAARREVTERGLTIGCIAAPYRQLIECAVTGGRVAGARCVV